MAKTNVPTDAAKLPDWWQREKQRRQVVVLIFLGFVLLLIGYFKWEALFGRIGISSGVNFDTANYIVFVRKEKNGHTALYAARADGSDLRRLTDPNDNSDKLTPTWTTDGKSVLYVSNRTDSQVRQIYLLGSGDPRQLTSGSGKIGSGNKDAPVASPDGQHVAYVTQGAIKEVLLNGNDVVQVLPPPRAGNADTGDPAALAQAGPEFRGAFLSTAYSSDGRGIAGVQDVSGEDAATSASSLSLGDQVARVIAPGGGQALLLDTGSEVSIAWEPNGQRLACAFTEYDAGAKPDLSKEYDTTRKPGQTQIVSGIRIYSFANPNKPTVQPLFAGMGYSIAPKHLAWSPDGKMMAFEGWRIKGEGDRECRGIILNPDITQPGVAIDAKQADSMRYFLPAGPQGIPQKPRWSPDGSRLLYEMVRPDGGRDLWIINTDGTNPINLTNGAKDGTDNYDGVWSPAHK